MAAFMELGWNRGFKIDTVLYQSKLLVDFTLFWAAYFSSIVG